MLFGKYKFSSVFINDAILPPYKGSTFRGGFGHALKYVVCNLSNQTCEECLMAKECVYIRLFEPKLLEKHFPEVKQMSTIPSPFVIEPPLTEKSHFIPNDAFDFNLLLFGDNNKFLPYFVFAFDQMGKKGVGKHIDGHRGQFKLKTVKHEKQLIYSDEKFVTDNIENMETLTIDVDNNNNKQINAVKIIIDTPLRFKINRKISTELTFERLVRVMLRRVSFLLASYGPGNPDLDYTEIIQKAKSVKMSNNNLKWYDWNRYSARQDRKMNMGGLVGSVVYEGSIEQFIPFIDFCSKVHIGKQTTFGLGKIRWEVLK